MFAAACAEVVCDARLAASRLTIRNDPASEDAIEFVDAGVAGSAALDFGRPCRADVPAIA
jgi:hypothetical protein